MNASSRSRKPVQIVRVAMVAAMLWGAETRADSARPPEQSSSTDESWREAVNCGPNSLYLLMRSHGWQGALKDVRNHFGRLDAEGCSLEDIRRAASDLDFQVTVTRTSVEQLLNAGSLPAIVHLDNRGNAVGHFVLLVDAYRDPLTNQAVVRMLDPIAASYFQMQRADFQRNWSTYAVIASDRNLARRTPLQSTMLSCGVAVLALGALFLRSTLRTRRASPRAAQS